LAGWPSGIKERAELTLASGVLQWLHTPLLILRNHVKGVRVTQLLKGTTTRSAQHSPALA
jgi:hypothetical protein